uniref:F-box domain-containing protein n=1 Tax=Bionectria ochroleuca TaxID=29856 RepID=A0A8H7TVU4_BIOOC
MNILSLPPELVTRIFDEFASSVEVKRVMRRRVVSHQFKRFIDDAIFRLCLLDGHKNKTEAVSYVDRYLPRPEGDFIAEYFAYQASVAKEPTSIIGRIWRAAEVVSERAGDAGQESARARLKSLCLFSLKDSSLVDKLFKARRRSRPTKCSAASLAADDRVAAVYLGDEAYIQTLVAQESDVFGSAFDAAALAGDVPMMRLLLSSNRHYDPPGSIMSSYIQRHILNRASVGGYANAFDFALDSGPPLDLEAGENRELPGPEWDCLQRAIAKTPIVENYKRGAGMFSPDSKVFDKKDFGDLDSRLTRSAGLGFVDKMNYFLGLGASPDGEDQSNFKPLSWGIPSGNPEVVRILLAHGADPNRSSPGWCASERRFTAPIVVAVFKEDMEMFNLLRHHGARLDTPETGNWAMAVARLYQLDCMVRMLEQEGVEKDAVLHRCANAQESYDYDYIFPAPIHLEWEHDPEVAVLLGVLEAESEEE